MIHAEPTYLIHNSDTIKARTPRAANRNALENMIQARMAEIFEWLSQCGIFLLWVIIWLICIAGLILSCLSLSGTWLVVVAALITMPLRPTGFPGWRTITGFVLLSAVVELAEWLAGAWGVTRRGGSRWAGWAAVGGGLIGLVAGALIPIPVVGNLIGMMAGSFLCAFAVERFRLQHIDQAAYIAWGAVLGRIAAIVIKVVATLAMIAFLVMGLIGGRSF